MLLSYVMTGMNHDELNNKHIHAFTLCHNKRTKRLCQEKLGIVEFVRGYMEGYMILRYSIIISHRAGTYS